MNNIEQFKSQCTVLDTETTNCIPQHAEIVEISGYVWNNDWTCNGEILLGTNLPIPPEASAKNNISQRMISGLPKFDEQISSIKTILNWDYSKYFVAHNCRYDQTVLAKAWYNAGYPSEQNIATNNNYWICTYRLAKHILGDFDDMQFNLGYLRYRLDLDVSENIGSHRARDDTLVCCRLLDTLIDIGVATDVIDPNQPIGPQLNRICWSPFVIKTWPFGKNKGKLLSELPTDFYLWALDKLDILNDQNPSYDWDFAESVRIELESRIKT